MGKLTKMGRLREKIYTDVKHAKQSTFYRLPSDLGKDPVHVTGYGQKKQIRITELNYAVRKDELAVKAGFKLLPSKGYFSKVWYDLFFEGQKLSSAYVNIPQGPIAGDDFEVTSVLDMQGIYTGLYTIKVEMFEQWATGEILTYSTKEFSVRYVPANRHDRLIKIPTVKSVAGADIAVISSDERSIYRSIKQDMRKEIASKRDQW